MDAKLDMCLDSSVSNITVARVAAIGLPRLSLPYNDTVGLIIT